MQPRYIGSYLLILFFIAFLPVYGIGDMVANIHILRIFQGEEKNVYLGASPAALGDIDRDGYADFAFGVPGADNERGRVDIYFGHPNPDSLKKRTINGSEETVYFGYNIKNIGDINRDSKADLLIVSHNATRDYEIVHVYTGNDTGWFDYTKSYVGEEKYDGFGYELGSGDFNGDGFSDFLIGAPKFDRQRGKVYIYLGGDTIADEPYLTFQGDSSLACFTGSIAGVGDINHDGYDDFVVGGPSGDPNGIINAGYFKLYLGGIEIDTIPEIELSGYREYQTIGSTFCSGFFNGDSVRDFIVGSGGEAYMYFGKNDLDTNPDLIFGTPEVPLGYLSYAGDINNDGYDDFLSSNPYYGYNNGLVDIYLGSRNFDTLYDYRIYGEWASYFGRSLSTAGDVNGDGLDEFLVSESYLLGIQGQGRVYLYSGDSTLVEIDGQENNSQPASFKINGNYPNPFNDTTTIRYSITNSGIYYFKIYNITGQLIYQKRINHQSAGQYHLTWNAKDTHGEGVSSGLYFVTLIHEGYNSNPIKMLLLK